MNERSEKVHIIIVNDDSDEVQSIKKWLAQDMRVPWTAAHCVKISEVTPRVRTADLIILKPEMKGMATPEQVYKSIEDMVFEIPIIVLTNPGDPRKLSTYVMEQGAADTLIRGQFARLVDAVEFALIRQRITTEARIASDQTLSDSKEKGLSDSERHKQILRMFTSDYAVDQGDQ